MQRDHVHRREAGRRLERLHRYRARRHRGAQVVGQRTHFGALAAFRDLVLGRITLAEFRTRRTRDVVTPIYAPLVAGGQGRDAWQVERAVMVAVACVATAVVLALVAHALGGRP